MRNLTIKQKKLLKKWYREKEPTKEKRMLLGAVNPIGTVDDLSLQQMEELEKINDTEILWQNINAFLYDLRFENI